MRSQLEHFLQETAPDLYDIYRSLSRMAEKRESWAKQRAIFAAVSPDSYLFQPEDISSDPGLNEWWSMFKSYHEEQSSLSELVEQIKAHHNKARDLSNSIGELYAVEKIPFSNMEIPNFSKDITTGTVVQTMSAVDMDCASLTGWHFNRDNQYERLADELQGFDLKGNNLVLAGGSLSGILTDHAYADLDFFLVRNTDYKQAMRAMHKHLCTIAREGVIITRNHNTITFSFRKDRKDMKNYRMSKWQIIFREYTSIAQVLYGFDVNACQIAYDGQRFYLTPGSFLALYHGLIYSNNDLWSLSYPSRICKYANRGYAVYFMETEIPIDYLTQFNVTKDIGLFIMVNNSYGRRVNIAGFTYRYGKYFKSIMPPCTLGSFNFKGHEDMTENPFRNGCLLTQYEMYTYIPDKTEYDDSPDADEDDVESACFISNIRIRGGKLVVLTVDIEIALSDMFTSDYRNIKRMIVKMFTHNPRLNALGRFLNKHYILKLIELKLDGYDLVEDRQGKVKDILSGIKYKIDLPIVMRDITDGSHLQEFAQPSGLSSEEWYDCY